MTDGEVAVSKEPRGVIRVIADLQSQPRPIGAYKWKILKEHSVPADVQTRYTCPIRVENHDWRDRSEIHRPGPVHIGNGLTASKGLPSQVCCDRQAPGDVPRGNQHWHLVPTFLAIRICRNHAEKLRLIRRGKTGIRNSYFPWRLIGLRSE